MGFFEGNEFTLMSAILMLSVVSGLYFLTALKCFYRGDWPHGGMWMSYGLANMFLLAYEYKVMKGL